VAGPKTLSDVEALLASLKPVVFAPRLAAPQRMPELMEFLGNPQEKYKTVHVAGTSGKTSTAYYTAALLVAAGKRVGLNISPHAELVNERVQLNGAPLGEARFCADFGRFWKLLEASGVSVNYFQAITAFAFWEFAELKVEYAVVEVGIGGLADSTNVISRQDKVCVITDIGYGHTGVLGKTLPEIAAHKAGIIQLHNVVFCRGQAEEIMAEVRERAQHKQADLYVVNNVAELSFLPDFQQRNFAMAEAAASYVAKRDGLAQPSPEALGQAAHADIPARMEVHDLSGGQTLVLDAAHNPQKVQALVKSVQERFPQAAIAVLFAPTKTRGEAYDEMLAALKPVAPYLFFTSYPSSFAGRFESADPEKLQARWQALGGSGEVIEAPEDAFKTLRQRKEPVLLVTGSFYILNHVRPLLPR
jgi:dihydrofolate synthase/folylpolyglutamate synthase